MEPTTLSPPPPTSKKMSKLSLSKRKAQTSKPDIGSNAKERKEICNVKIDNNSKQEEVTSKYFSTTPSTTLSNAISNSERRLISTGSDKHDTNPPIQDTKIAKNKVSSEVAEMITSSSPKFQDSRSPIRRKDESTEADGRSATTSKVFSTKAEPIEIIDVDEATVLLEKNVNCPAENSVKVGDTVNTPSKPTLVSITNSLVGNPTKPESSTLRKRKLLSLGKNKKIKL